MYCVFTVRTSYFGLDAITDGPVTKAFPTCRHRKIIECSLDLQQLLSSPATGFYGTALIQTQVTS